MSKNKVLTDGVIALKISTRCMINKVFETLEYKKYPLVSFEIATISSLEIFKVRRPIRYPVRVAKCKWKLNLVEFQYSAQRWINFVISKIF